MFSSDRHDLPRRRQFLSNWSGFRRIALSLGSDTLIICSLGALLTFVLPVYSTEMPVFLSQATAKAQASGAKSDSGQSKTDSSESDSDRAELRTEQSGSYSESRPTLKGATQHIEYRLNDMEAYRRGMAALDRRDFSAAQAFFKAAAAQLGEGYEKYRGECFFFQAKCLAMSGNTQDAIQLYGMAAKLFEQYDPKNPYKGIATMQVSQLTAGRARMDSAKLQTGVSARHARVSIDQHITLLAGATKNDTSNFLLKVDKESVSKTVFNCFAEMTCLETAEIGSNVNNAVGRWQPLLVEESPAAFALGQSNPQINVKMDGTVYKIGLPTFRGLKRILLATDGEQICAMDLDSNDSWLLRLKKNADGSLGTVRWAKLVHMKTKVERGVAVTAPKHVWDAKGTSSRGWDSRNSRSQAWESRHPGVHSGGRGSSSGGFLGGDSAHRFIPRGSRSGARGSSGF